MSKLIGARGYRRAPVHARGLFIAASLAILLGCTSCATQPVSPGVSPGESRSDAPAPGCPPAGRGAVVDRERQRGWLCEDSFRIGAEMPITTAWPQPVPGIYAVYAKDRVTTSSFGGRFSYLDHFVAFARGIYTGARVGFHAVPRSAAGVYFQPFESVGQLERRGESAGCIRVLPHDAVRIWDWLSVGDAVVVIS